MIEVNENVVEVCIESIIAQVVDAYAEKQKIPVTDALRLFMTTKTYELLTNPKSYLYLEAAPYVEDMLIAELSGDWESWMEAKKWKCGNLMMSYIFKQALRENICGGTI